MASGAQKGARTRKWNKEFDFKGTLEALGATPKDVGGLGVMPNGKYLSVGPATVGRFTVTLHEPLQMRTFPVGQMALAREWVESGGKLASEERKKRLVATAPDAYAVCVELIRGGGTEESRQRAIDGALAVIAIVEEK